MEELLMDMNWTATLVGAVAAFLVGWLWYSDKLFGAKWRAGVGLTGDTKQKAMAPAMVTQIVGTFLLAWVIGITETTNSLAFAILIALTIAVLVKANGLFAGKSKYAIMVESGFILVMVIVMIAVHAAL
jgi:hypothetical protein